jgi:hypothetical protein
MQIKVVISAHNDASKPYNITAVMGSLNSPSDFDLYIQNFTQQVWVWDLFQHPQSRPRLSLAPLGSCDLASIYTALWR